MINGIFLGILTAISTIMTFVKLPQPVQKWLCEHELLTDFGLGLMVWAILGYISKTIVAVIGASIAEITLAVFLNRWRKRYGY